MRATGEKQAGSHPWLPSAEIQTPAQAQAHDDGTDDRVQLIATLAAERAKRRGLACGYEQVDWLSAEAEVLAQIYGLTGSAC